MNKRFNPQSDVRACSFFREDQNQVMLKPAGCFFNPSPAGGNTCSAASINYNPREVAGLQFRSPYPPNPLLLTPAIFGGAGAFLLGFGFYGHCLSGGYNKFVFFMIVLALIASLGVGAYIYQARLGRTTLGEVIIPSLILIFFFGAIYNLIYSLYPATFSGTIGKTPLTQFLSFFSISVGSVSVGETVNVIPEKPEIQVLLSIEFLFSLFALTVIIAIVAS
jgi:hypothetical protein